MSCYCDYDQPEFYKQVWKKANKEHRCCECGYTVKKGGIYEHVSGKWDGSLGSYKTCERCVDDQIGQVQKVLNLHRNWSIK